LSLIFTDKSSEIIGNYISKSSYSSKVILVDENTDEYCYDLISNSLSDHYKIKIKSGEEFKNIDTCNYIWQQFTNYQLDRNSLLINLGGGVIGDMGGFCAATYKRGIDFINIPTTLLAQVDASIGGKLGVDFNGFKNHIGLFKEPNAVIIDPVFLHTLPNRQLLSGFAEVIKHSIIASKDQWNYLLNVSFDKINFLELIPKSIAIKKKIVDEDPHENGKRKILNVGHTAGHAIESFYLNSDQKLLHGEAVAAGIICESYISNKLNLLSSDSQAKIETLIDRYYYRKNSVKEDASEIFKLAMQDKKNKGNKILMALPDEIGHAQYDIEVGEQLIHDSLNYYSKH